MTNHVKDGVTEMLIRKTRMIIETVYFDIMMGIVPALQEVMPDDTDSDNVTEFMLSCCSEALVHEITNEGTISMVEGTYISMLIYPMLTGGDVRAKIEEMIPETPLEWLAHHYKLDYKAKHLAE